MHDWIVVLLIGLASLGIGYWALRQRSPANRVAEPTNPDAARSVAASASVGPSSGIEGTSVADKGVDAPNTKILPHPEDRQLATLEFDGPPGHVAINRGVLVIGRHSSDDVRVPDVRVSRHHARLVAHSNGSFEIHNLTAVRSEPNPMLVNGENREHADIADGDVVTLGGVSFKFRQTAA